MLLEACKQETNGKLQVICHYKLHKNSEKQKNYCCGLVSCFQ